MRDLLIATIIALSIVFILSKSGELERSNFYFEDVNGKRTNFSNEEEARQFMLEQVKSLDSEEYKQLIEEQFSKNQ